MCSIRGSGVAGGLLCFRYDIDIRIVIRIDPLCHYHLCIVFQYCEFLTRIDLGVFHILTAVPLLYNPLREDFI